MQSLLRTALALTTASAVLAACTDQPSSPTAPNGPRVSLPAGAKPLVLVGSCDVNQLKTDARGLAAKSNDALLSIIGDIPAALKTDAAVPNGPVPGNAATDKAFDGLSRMAVIRGSATLQKSDATGLVFDNLVRGFLKCSKSTVYGGAVEPAPPTGAGGFKQALGKNWVFEVRGKSSTDGSDFGGAYERGSTDGTWWALWPRDGSWSSDILSTPTTHRVLIYGYRTSSSELSGRVGSSFDHFLLPAVQKVAGPTQFVLEGTVGLCVADASSIEVDLGKQRVNHANKFLPLPTAQPTCASPPAFTETTGSLASGMLNPARLAQRAVAFFWPRPLYATTLFAGGSVTGSPDDFSPSAVYDLSAFHVAQPGPITTIANGITSVPLKLVGGGPVTVQVTVDGVSGIELAPDGTPVTISIAGNSSSIAYFQVGTGPVTPTVTRTTVGGIADFGDVKLTKAGGYQLQFAVVFDGVQGQNVLTSNSFNMQNK